MTNLPFGFDQPEDSPGFLLWQTTMIWQRQIRKALEPYGISHPQFVIMATLLWFDAHGHETTQTLIIHQTKLDKMTVSKSLKNLGNLGYVIRSEHTADTRAKSVILTEKGKELVRTLVPIVEWVDHLFFKACDSTSEKDLIQILRKLVQADKSGM